MRADLFSLLCLSLLALAASAASPNQAAEPALASVRGFLKQHCAECHANGAAEGGVDLDKLTSDLQDRAAFAKWERIHDRVQSGEMPPPDQTRPAPAAVKTFVQDLGDKLSAAHATSKGTVLRRLNRREYENTLNDLFGTNLAFAERLPEDGRAHEFDNVGEALGISMVQMQRYLECAELVQKEAIQATIAAPKAVSKRLSYAETQGAAQWLGKIWLQRDDGAVVFFRSTSYPDGLLKEASISKAGYYKVRVTGYAYQSDKPIVAHLSLKSYKAGAGQPTLAYLSLPPGAPTTFEGEYWIEGGYMLAVAPVGLLDQKQHIQKNGVEGYAGPGLAIQHVEFEGPLVKEFPTRGHELIFAGLDRQELMPRNKADRERIYYVPKFELKLTDPRAEVAPVLERVATRLFRRPVKAAELSAQLNLFDAQLKDGSTPEEALRGAVSALLCSPRFLYLQENPGKLDDYALASRLSYFLLRTAPDGELLQRAADKTLAEPKVLAAQVERLLADSRSERFITDFTDSWLNLRELEFTNPDEKLFPEYDRYLLWSIEAETRGFVRKLFQDDAPVTALIRPGFAMLNERLAEHYGIEGVTGTAIRAVPLPPDSVRGGLLGQAAIHKVSANGSNTSPVVRGVWVMERLLAQPPQPPPPGIPGVEPDIRGSTTLREILDKHRSVVTCNACHRQIDPPGFALECFDPIGTYRERFRSLGDGEPVKKEVHGRKVSYKNGPPVDMSGELPDGRKFAGFVEFRDLLAKDEAALTRAMVIKLLTFGTGREPGFSDRAEIEKLVHAAIQKKAGLRQLLQMVVQSEIFRSK